MIACALAYCIVWRSAIMFCFVLEGARERNVCVRECMPLCVCGLPNKWYNGGIRCVRV